MIAFMKISFVIISFLSTLSAAAAESTVRVSNSQPHKVISLVIIKLTSLPIHYIISIHCISLVN
jgi:hypothetical protein